MVIWLAVIASIGLLATIIFPIGRVGAPIKKNVDGTNLRTIGQAMLAADSEHPGALSAASSPDLYAFIAEFARESGLNDPHLWLSKVDAISPIPRDLPPSILLDSPFANGKRPLNAAFRGLPIAFAVASFPPGTKLADLPSTTPLAWTRGLQPDGTWSKTTSPYGEWGGFIVFVGGNLEKYREIDGKIISTQGKETDDIRETLPPGTRILEFTPKR